MVLDKKPASAGFLLGAGKLAAGSMLVVYAEVQLTTDLPTALLSQPVETINDEK